MVDGLRLAARRLSAFNPVNSHSTFFRKGASKKGHRGQKNKNAASRLVQFDINPFVISRNLSKFTSKKHEKSRKIELFQPKITKIGGKLHGRAMASRPHRRSSQNENPDSPPPFRELN
jgi:hypothetical protein